MVFGISFGKIQAEEIRLIRENGTASSGRIEDGTEEQYAKLKQLDYIKQVGKSIFVGEATDISEDNAKTICNVVWADSESWNNFLKPAYTNVIGSYPQKKDEILLSERALKKLGISEPDQGMEINLDVYKGVFEHSKEKFKLCGWYTDSGNELAIGYISYDKINELNLEKGSYTLLFSQSNHLSRSKTEEKLYEDFCSSHVEVNTMVNDILMNTLLMIMAETDKNMLYSNASCIFVSENRQLEKFLKVKDIMNNENSWQFKLLQDTANNIISNILEHIDEYEDD